MGEINTMKKTFKFIKSIKNFDLKATLIIIENLDEVFNKE